MDVTHKAPSVPDSPTAPQSSPLSSAYDANVLRVIDGDTLEAAVQVWPGQTIVTKIRLMGVDAPERRGRCGEERRRAQAAAERLAALAGTRVLVSDLRPDKYFGRVVARLATPDGQDIGRRLLDAPDGGLPLAHAYGGKRRPDWCVDGRSG